MKAVKWLAVGVGALAVLAFGWLWFGPVEEDVAPDRGPLAAVSPGAAEAVGWYASEDSVERLLTWSADGGFAFYRFGRTRAELLRTPLVSDGPLRFRSATGSTPNLVLTRGDSGAVGQAVWTTSSDVQRFRRIDGPYETREVEFSSGGERLAGLLFVPTTPGPHPGAVFIHGSGASSRDGHWYLSPADELARSGAVVLVPDKRGTGKSAGDWRTAAFDDFAADTRAALSVVREVESIDPERVGVVGLSQRAWVAPIVAVPDADHSVVASIVGSAATPEQQLAYELANDMVDGGAPAFVVPGVRPLLERRVKRRRPTWWASNGGFDPIPLWRSVDVPVLWVAGSTDRNVDSRRTEQLLSDAGLLGPTGFSYLSLPGLDHALTREDSGWLDRTYLSALVEFVLGAPLRPEAQ
ncbi:MAG: CocE/NonD family hydrolase [Gemmatimonadota bacterium]